ncbi:MAG: hypothetical protein FGM57_03245, partial [Candidatus Taylorbacteria bacterium]|nr:hypothetical protein [Candidatus Taylorbacteria bacterium]
MWLNNQNNIFSKVVCFMVLIAIFSANSVAFAQGTGNTNTTTGGTQQIQGSATTIPARDAQVEGYMSGARKSDVDGQSEVAFNLIGCSAGQLLSNIIQAGFNSLFGSLTGQLKNQVVRLVPIDTQYTELEKDTKLQTQNDIVLAEHTAETQSVAHVEAPVALVEPNPVSTPIIEHYSEDAQETVIPTGDCSLAYNYDWPADIAYQICMKESGGNQYAANHTDNHMSWAGCMGSYGLMQLNCSHGEVYDPVH